MIHRQAHFNNWTKYQETIFSPVRYHCSQITSMDFPPIFFSVIFPPFNKLQYLLTMQAVKEFCIKLQESETFIWLPWNRCKDKTVDRQSANPSIPSNLKKILHLNFFSISILLCDSYLFCIANVTTLICTDFPIICSSSCCLVNHC